MAGKEKLWREAAVLLIDHQRGTELGETVPLEEMKRNAVMLAKPAKILKRRWLLTSSMEDHAQGPLMPELEEAAAKSSVRGSSGPASSMR